MRVKRVDGLAWQAVGVQTIVMDLDRGRSLGLNQTAGLVWALLADMEDEQIASELVRQYGIHPERARLDVKAILTTFRERGLVEEASPRAQRATRTTTERGPAT